VSVNRGLAVLCVAVGAFAALPAAQALACENGGARPGAVPEHTYARAVACIVNEQRARAGLAALRYDRRLARAASGYPEAMVREGFFAHVSPEGSTLGQRARAAGYRSGTLGETIAWGSGELSTPAAIVDAWMHSPPHRAVLMSGAFRRIGLGVASGAPTHVPGAATVTADFGG
jgi:uncharacterized protein YkwD